MTRAVYCKDTFPSSAGEFQLDNPEVLHHLLRVVRLNRKEKVLLLDGLGQIGRAEVLAISKNKIVLNVLSFERVSRTFRLNVALPVIKKKALGHALRMSCELGVEKIYLWQADYGQNQQIDLSKLQAHLIAGLEQSNGAYLPELIMLNSLKDATELSIPKICFEHQVAGDNSKLAKPLNDEILMMIGPEGGFSSEEKKLIIDCSEIFFVSLPTSILRTETALAAGLGYLFAQMGH